MKTMAHGHTTDVHILHPGMGTMFPQGAAWKITMFWPKEEVCLLFDFFLRVFDLSLLAGWSFSSVSSVGAGHHRRSHCLL